MYLFVSPGDRPRKLYAERALNLPLGAELITGNMWYCCQIFILLSFPPLLYLLFLYLQQAFSLFTVLPQFLPVSYHSLNLIFFDLIRLIPHINLLTFVCVFSDLLSTSSNSECQDGMVGGHTDCPFQRRIIPAHRLRPRRTHPEIFQVSTFTFYFGLAYQLHP